MEELANVKAEASGEINKMLSYLTSLNDKASQIESRLSNLTDRLQGSTPRSNDEDTDARTGEIGAVFDSMGQLDKACERIFTEVEKLERL